MNNIKGTGVALITPFKKDKSIDYNSLERLLEHVISNGVDYLVLMGTTGESAVLSNDEQLKIIDYCKKINSGRLPIVLGIGGNCTHAIIDRILKTDFELPNDLISEKLTNVGNLKIIIKTRICK